MSEDEQVLTVERRLIPAEWLPEFGCYPITQKDFLRNIGNWPRLYLFRSQVENDPRYKQIIPYVILFDEYQKVFCYPRQGSEKRLHALYSVGIGGHINREEDGAADFWATVLNGLRRELMEETALNPETDRLEFYGIINEERTKVGHVHWGLVFLYRVNMDDKNRLKVSPELYDYTFCPVEEFLKTKKYEYWSGLALQLINERMRQK